MYVSVAVISAHEGTRQDALAALHVPGNADADAVAKHRLTAVNLRQMFAVDRELYPLMKTMPDFDKRVDDLAGQIDPQRGSGQLTVTATVYEAMPEVAAILRKHKISARGYLLTHVVAMVTAMADDTLRGESLGSGKAQEVPPELMTPALKFWRSMDAALKAEAAEWKAARGYDKGINR